MRKEEGSIAIFVLVALLFMSAFLIISFASNINKSKTVKEQYNIISGIYAYANGEEGAYDKAYSDLRKKNKQTMTASIENSSILELTKTFDENMSNYRIYGNSVQNGIPTSTNPVEVQSVGDTVNLINVADFNVSYENGYYINTNTGFLLQPNCTYTLSFNYKVNSASATVGCSVGYGATAYAHDIKTSQYPNQINGRGSCIFTTPSDIGSNNYLSVRFARTDLVANINVDISSIQLEYGAIATDYVPYGKYRIPIESKNVKNEINLINVADFNESYENLYFNARGMQFLLQSNCTYTLSFNYKVNSASANLYCGIGYGEKGYARDIKEIKYPNQTSGRCSCTFTTPADMGNINYLFVRFTRTQTKANVNVDISSIQLEYGTTATEYTPYKVSVLRNIHLNEPLRKIGNYADYIDFKTGKVVRNIGKIESYNGETITTSWISETGELSTGATVYYVLETPREETVNLPQLKSFEDYTKIEVLTSVAPSKIEAEYIGYTLE